MSERLQRDTPYPLRDWHNCYNGRPDLAAYWTGEKRPPRKGEWYLSGAIIEAYQAPNDLMTSYHIAAIHRVAREVVVTKGERV